jgi:type II secretory pathway pseudopilin PulG
MAKTSLNTDGYTIVELIISIIVGTILVMAISLYISSHTHLAKRAKDITAVNLYANNKVEALRSKGFLGLTNGTTSLTSELPTELSKPKSGSMVISSESSAIKRVVLTITYNDQGANRTYTYTTFIGELGVGQY